MGLKLVVNGQARELEAPAGPLKDVVEAMGLRADRIAVELNGEIAPRTRWEEILVREGDRLEVVHFVGGGSGPAGTGPRCGVYPAACICTEQD